jgi:hypothetical protein
MTTQTSTLLKWANISAYILMVLVNGLVGSTTIIGGKITSEISDANPPLITPAGYVFSIWGIIYVLLGIFVVVQALPSEKGKDYKKSIGWLFVLSSIFNVVWIFLWQFEYLSLSVVLMFLLLASLISIYLRLDIGKTKVGLREKFVVHVPFSTYLGWITIASIANIAVTLVSVNWGGFGIIPETWATLIIAVALLITILVLVKRADIAYGLVIIWAFLGIAAGQIGNQNIIILAQASAVIVLLVVAATILLTKQKLQ